LLRRLAVLVALVPTGATAQQATQAIIQQPFGQKPPPPPPPAPTPQQQQQLDREHHRLPGWLYRGLVAAAARSDEAVEIDTPVTGYGNEALWEVPELAVQSASDRAQHHRVALDAHPAQRRQKALPQQRNIALPADHHAAHVVRLDVADRDPVKRNRP
jgi:hypothetical protein